MKFKISFFWWVPTLVGLVVTLYLAINGVREHPNVPFFLLPLIYSIVSFIVYSQYNYKVGPGFITIGIVGFIRYVVLPLSISINDQMSVRANTYNYLTPAVWVMVYEYLCIGAVLFINRQKYKNCQFLIKEIALPEIRNSSLIALVVALFVVGVAILYKDFRAGISLLSPDSVYTRSRDGMSSGLGIAWSAMFIWLYIYLVIREADKNNSNRTIGIFRSLIYTIVLIALVFLDQSSLSRWYTIVIAAAAMGLLTKLFPNNRREVFLGIGIPAIALIVFASMLKNGGLFSDSSSTGNSIYRLLSPGALDVYFAGPVNVNNAINLKENSNLNITCIFNDMLNNMPVVNHYLDPSKTTVYNYNASLGRLFGLSGDQIIPMIGQSMIYFGYILSPTLSVIMVNLMVINDIAYLRSSSFRTFVYAFCAVWFSATCMMLNLTICMAWVYIRILPFYIVCYITDKNITSRVR